LEARVEHWFPRVRTLVTALYGQLADVDDVCDQLLKSVRAAAAKRSIALRAIDARREVDPAWFHQPGMIGYVAYADRFGGTLAGIADHVEYLDELHVTYLHLMKVLRARRGANDGGYAVVDYRDVDPALGTRADLESLIGNLHEHGISVCLDVVMNHTAEEHSWAEQARAGSVRHRDYYLVFPDRTMPDQYERSLPEVFPEIAPGNFTWDDQLQGWVWTTFNTYQWDLNYANPAVVVEMLDIMLDLANLGVDVLRLDAVAFTWKRLGTNCQNQPEAHLIAQLFRALLAIAAPGTLLKAEAIVAPADLLPYLGVHRLERPECHLAYHNQLMVMLWSSLATGDATLAAEALRALPPTPPGAGWVNYVRCHDDIGWAISDSDAARVGVSGPAHRHFLANFYRGDFAGTFADGVAFSANPDIGDERTCGTAAALCGIGAAIRSADRAALSAAISRLTLIYGVMFGFGGIPLIYMGDELALDNDRSYENDPSLAGDSRWTHRPWMPWSLTERRHDECSVEHRVFEAIGRFAAVRRETPSMAAGGDTWIHDLPDAAVLGWQRRHAEHGTFYGLANFSDKTALVPREVLGWAALDEPRELLHLGAVTMHATTLELAPFGLAWFADDADTVVQPPHLVDRSANS
jgi:amylosucrase